MASKRANRASFRLDSPLTPGHPPRSLLQPSLPSLSEELPFVDVVRRLCESIEDIIEIPWTFEQLKTGDGALVLQPLVASLTGDEDYDNGSHPLLVAALLVLRYHFKDPDDRGVSQSRAYACELLAWRVTLSYSRQERLEALLGELPPPERRRNGSSTPPSSSSGPTISGEVTRNSAMPNDDEEAAESTGMLRKFVPKRVFGEEVSFLRQFAINQMRHLTGSGNVKDEDEEDPTVPFVGLNALEIAAVADAKKFLSQKAVQRAINAIWDGDIMFWDSVSVHAQRKARYYNRRRVDPYCRLRVPKYQKTFETIFLLAFLAFYYIVMQENNTRRLTSTEILLYIWIAAFTYEDVGSFFDTGMRFYTTDLWNLMDLCIIGIALAYVVTRATGLSNKDDNITGLAFEILSLMAVPLVPRTFSLLSLHPYFGILIPSLSQMTRDLLKFLVIVLVVYFGFASTFVLLARNAFTAKEVFWLLIYVFNGSGDLGLNNSDKISQSFGPTLMVIFVCITNILLLPTLISLLTNSLTMVMGNAREEFLFQYSVLVLESCASKRLTYFFPPLNLIPLVFLRPLRLIMPGSQVRSARIVLLKVTHAPFVGLIIAYEKLFSHLQRDPDRWRTKAALSRSLQMPGRHSRSLSEGLARPDTSRRNEAPVRSAWRPPQEARTFDDLSELVGKLSAQVERLEQRLGE